MYEYELLKIPYFMEVLDYLEEVSTSQTLFWVRIFETKMDGIHRGHHIPK